MDTSDQEGRLRARRDKGGLAAKGGKPVVPARSDPASPAEGDNLDPSALHHVMGFLIAMADVTARRVFRQHIGQPFDLRDVEFTLLVLLKANHGAAPKQLARSLNLPAPHVSLLLDRTVERGFVERRRSPKDGRALQIHLTAQGEALAQRVHQVSQTMENELLQVLSPAERAMLRELLIKLASTRV